ncbi:hypothetical protein IX335_000841 [Porphyromonas levii]|uniref:helix-turn-helix transcriptional regulator n=1 Tax=Porphyromonas levii TaxID=28114 RepID=UPI001BA5C3DF|nr:WYL domain-containing protein [Porphyromonas levii]MBR8763626.1 hypothetical protein [Porphyromonas levii]
MPINRNALMRIRTIDACLRRRNRKWTLDDLREACEEALYDYEGIPSISKRTIQRDLELMRSDKLGYNAPIEVVDRKYYVYSDPEYSIAQLPLTKEDLAELSSAVDIINHYKGFRGLTGLDGTLTQIQDKIHSHESHQQVVFLDTNEQLKGLEFLSPLYEYIIGRRPLIISYHSFSSTKTNKFKISPYLLKEYNNRWFLLGYSRKLRDIMILALDRIEKIEEDSKGVFDDNIYFNPSVYFAEMIGVTRNLDSPKERVTIWVDADQAPYIITKPIHSEQEVIEYGEDGSIVISIELILNLELERVILGYGSHVEVIAPKKLRDRIANQILFAATRYTK